MNRLSVKTFGFVFLFCLFASAMQAQESDALLQRATDSLTVRPDIAVEILNQALTADPDSEELLKVRAEAYENLKQYDKAVADYTRLTRMSPDEENLWYLLGRNLYKNKQYAEALKSLNRATKLNPQYLPAFHVKIRALLQLNKNEEALNVSDSTLNIGETAMNYFLLGEVYSRLKSWQKAEWAYGRAAKIDKGYIEAYIALADIAVSMNKVRETLTAADAALGIDPDSKEALIARSRGFALDKNFTDAIDDATYVIKLDPSYTDAYYWRGTYYKETNKTKEAIKDFEFVLKEQPDNWQALAGRAECYAKTGDKKAALADFQKLLADASHHPESEAITQSVNRQIFEMNRENHAPELTLLDPSPDNFDIQIPDSRKSITIKGKITDESAIGTLTVNGSKVPVTPIGGNFEFTATVKADTAKTIHIEAADVYDNINRLTYQLVRTETAKPQIVLFTPKPAESGVITLASDTDATLYVEGKATDESAIVSIVVDGKAVDFDHDSAEPTFSAIIDIGNKTRFTVAVTDKFGNSTERTYTIEKAATAKTDTDSVSPPNIIPAAEKASQ